MNGDFPYLECMNIFKKCRNAMKDDTLGCSEDLYDALYSSVNSEICETKLELYEIQWLEKHWKMINETIDKRACSVAEKKELISAFAKWYRDFVSGWNYAEFDAAVFNEKMKILRALISMDSEWGQNLKRMKVSFEKDKKILNKKINELKMEG